jgi:hypothetical protein
MLLTTSSLFAGEPRRRRAAVHLRGKNESSFDRRRFGASFRLPRQLGRAGACRAVRERRRGGLQFVHQFGLNSLPSPSAL